MSHWRELFGDQPEWLNESEEGRAGVKLRTVYAALAEIATSQTEESAILLDRLFAAVTKLNSDDCDRLAICEAVEWAASKHPQQATDVELVQFVTEHLRSYAVELAKRVEDTDPAIVAKAVRVWERRPGHPTKSQQCSGERKLECLAALFAALNMAPSVEAIKKTLRKSKNTIDTVDR